MQGLSYAHLLFSRKHAIGGYYQKIIEEMCVKYSVKEEELFDPCRSIKVILADDNIPCNMTLRVIMEKLGKYQVHSFYNGTDV